MAQLNRLTAVDYADCVLRTFPDQAASTAAVPQLALVSSQETVGTGLLAPTRRLGVWICIASTVCFWTGVAALAF